MNSEENLNSAFKPGFDPVAKDLITKLLVKNPMMRLGMFRNGMRDIWTHPFFSAYEEDEIEEMKASPPFKPDSNFEDGLSIIDMYGLDITKEPTRIYTGKFDYTIFNS